MSQRGQGSGRKRRIRLQLNIVCPGSDTYLIRRNRSIKPLPVNWPAMLIEAVRLECVQPSRRTVGQINAGRAILAPSFVKPVGHPDVVLCSLDNLHAPLQRRIVDFILELHDVTLWPVPRTRVSTISGGDIAVATDLPLTSSFSPNGSHRVQHWIDLAGYAHEDRLNRAHIETYVARQGSARYVGVRTRCGERQPPCRCRDALPTLWHLGWNMSL